jgi:hypothetical protein
MNKLQNMLEDTLQKSFSPENLLVSIILKELKRKGIVISAKQKIQLKAQIKSNIQSSTFKFELDEEEFLKCPADLKKNSTKLLSLKIDSERELVSLNEKVSKITSKVVPKLTAEAAKTIYRNLKKSYPLQKQQHASDLLPFYMDIEKDWGKAIDLLEMLCFLASEAGSNFNNEFRASAAARKDFVFEVLSRLHARSCQITSEIILLLRHGFADGAHARWRTLHEISLFGNFIKKHGNNVAERYLYHDAIESYKAGLSFQKHCETLGYQKLNDEEFGAIKTKYDFCIKKYGIQFKNKYGWAAVAIKKDNPNISDIELDVGLAHMRPYYRMASHNIHANPKGIKFRLGLLPDKEDVLLAGPSNLGMTDPGHCTAISLLQITTTLLASIEPNLDRLVVLTILSNLEGEIGAAFIKAETRLRNRIEKLGERPP